LTGARRELCSGWELAVTAPDELTDADGLESLEWIPARVPGTAAAALREAGTWARGDVRDFDQHDWWFRARFDADPPADGEEVALALGGLATVAEVYLNGDRVLETDSMFASHRVEVGPRLRGANELAIRCRALAPLLRVSRRPRARWRTRLVSDGNLRFFRTMLLGRAPGFAPGPAAVGPWRPVSLERRRLLSVERLRVRARLDGDTGALSLRAKLRALAGARVDDAEVEVSGPSGMRRSPLELDGDAVSGELLIPGVEKWWPHTHGDPALHEVRLLVRAGGEQVAITAGQLGFRTLRVEGELERDGIQLRINDVPVFARGAVWTPPDLALPCTAEDRVAAVLESVVAAGMNMLRVPGIGCYEGQAFHDACDRLGILLWQDFMFANLDYPEQDAGFMETVGREVRQVLADLGHRPSLAVLCGGSEVAQQVAMMGLDPKLASGPLYGELLPSLVREADVDAPFVPSTPWGGDLPFRPDRGVANYYGVGAYLRPFEDARRSEVKFAAECLAFANVPDNESLEAIEAPGGLVVHHPSWKAGVPRDAAAGWDFDDVRDHYLRLLYELDPVALRYVDHERYLELSRAVSGEVMSEVFGEWRRIGSGCGGALILWLTDLMPGAGWGLLDHRALPKVAYHHLRRALAPIAVWSTDEGLGGVVAHVANDRPAALEATLRIAMYRELEVLVDEATHRVALGPHEGTHHNVEELLGRFVDASWAYRFGPPAQDLIVLSLERDQEEVPELLSQSFRLPAGRPARAESAATLGLSGTVRTFGEAQVWLTVSTRRYAHGVRVAVPGFVADDDAFSVEPGHGREVRLRPIGDDLSPTGGHLTALNLAGRVRVPRAQETSR
jgi:beta-mannosidase